MHDSYLFSCFALVVCDWNDYCFQQSWKQLLVLKNMIVPEVNMDPDVCADIFFTLKVI